MFFDVKFLSYHNHSEIKHFISLIENFFTIIQKTDYFRIKFGAVLTCSYTFSI